MVCLPSTVTNEYIFRTRLPAKISCHVPDKNIAEAVTRDMASSDWLKLAAPKNKCICDCAGARLQSDRATFLSKSFLPSSEFASILKPHRVRMRLKES